MRVGPELRSLLECLVSDNLEPALQKLNRAASVTDAQLREEWDRNHAARAARRTHPRS